MKKIITPIALLLQVLFAYGHVHPIQDNENSYPNAWLISSQAVKQRVDSLIIQMWDENTTSWDELSIEKFTYDAMGNMTQSIISSEFSGNCKQECTYTTNGNETQCIGYEWDESTSSWEQSDKEEYTYDANGNMTRSEGYGWDESTTQWFAADKAEYTYDAHGNLTQSVEYYWDGFSDKWVTQYKHEFTYNANGGRTQSSGYRWDESTSKWLPIDKLEYTYDASENIAQSLYHCWEEGSSKFVECWKEEYTHDEKGNIILNNLYEWDEGTEHLLGKYEYTFDTSYARSEMILPYFNDEISIIEALDIAHLFKHKMVGFLSSTWDEGSSEWIPQLRGDYFYSEQNVSSVNETGTEISRIYPNPCSEYLTFSFSGNYHQIIFELFDLQGRKLITRPIKNHETISLEGLENGIYVFELLTSDGKKQSGRLIKE